MGALAASLAVADQSRTAPPSIKELHAEGLRVIHGDRRQNERTAQASRASRSSTSGAGVLPEDKKTLIDTLTS